MPNRRDNPYEAPELPPESTPTQPSEKRWTFLVLPISVPPAVHLIARTQLARDEWLARGLIAAVGYVVASVWLLSMVDRLKLSPSKTLLISCALWIALFLSWMLTAKMSWP